MALRSVGSVRMTPTAASFSDLRVQAGEGSQPYVLTGSGELDYGKTPRFSLKLKGEQVDVDRVAGLGKGENAPKGEKAGLAARVEAMRKVLADVPRPPIPGTVDISLPVVVAGDTTIRDVAFKASPAPGGWSLAQLTAELPGRTRLQASGTVGLDDAFRFQGDLLVASRQPSGFSDWLSGTVAPSVRTLSQAGFTAKATLTPDRQVLRRPEARHRRRPPRRAAQPRRDEGRHGDRRQAVGRARRPRRLPGAVAAPHRQRPDDLERRDLRRRPRRRPGGDGQRLRRPREGGPQL